MEKYEYQIDKKICAMGYRRADYGRLFHVGTREMWALSGIFLCVHKSEKGRQINIMSVRDLEHL